MSTQPRNCCTVHAHTYALLHKPAPKRIHACEIDRGLQTASAFACVCLLCRAADVHLHYSISEESQGPSGHRFMRGSVEGGSDVLQDGEWMGIRGHVRWTMGVVGSHGLF